MKQWEDSTFFLILTLEIWLKQKKMKKHTMNSIFGLCQTVQTHNMKMEIEPGSILELEVSVCLSYSHFVISLSILISSGPCNVTVKFNLMNLNRQAKLYSQGMRPLFKVVPSINESWDRIKEKPICSVSYFFQY